MVLVALTCALVGNAGVFGVKIDDSAQVWGLKMAIKEQIDYSGRAKDLQLSLAKKDDAWLDRAGAAAVALDEHGHPQGCVQMDPTLWIKNPKHFGDNFQPGEGQVHVLVVVPKGANIVFSLRAPKRLVGSSGATWDFQNPLDTDSVADAVRTHYTAWKAGNTDKKDHPLFVCLGGPGTGKSRVLDEFPALVKEHIFKSEDEDEKMMKLLQKAFVFKVTFDNGTRQAFPFSHPGQAIGTRMAYQLQDTMSWSVFANDRANHRDPAQAMSIVSDITAADQSGMCVILCVDGMQELQHENGSKKSDFYLALAALSDVINASKCWVIAICSATIYNPVAEFLAGSAQWRYTVPTAILSRPKVQNVDVFETFDGDELTQLLIDDMGGHGRAVETLYQVMSSRANKKQTMEFMPIINGVLAGLRSKYPTLETVVDDMKKAFLAVIARRKVGPSSQFGKLTLDGVISTGLMRVEEDRLTCPYVLFLLMDSSSYPWNKFSSFAPKEDVEDVKPWETWEVFNCKYRALKTVAFAEEESVLWKQVHFGALFGRGCDRLVRERPCSYELLPKKMVTMTKGFSRRETCSCDNDPGRHYLYQPAAGSSSGDSFLCVEDVEKGFFHEVHQYKRVQADFFVESFNEEKAKAAGPDDIFVLYCTAEVQVDISTLENCAVVDKTCWKEYYGPFAARAYFVSTVPPPCLNGSPASKLLLVPGVGKARARAIAAKRPYTNYEDAYEKTKVPLEVLKRCKCDPSNY